MGVSGQLRAKTDNKVSSAVVVVAILGTFTLIEVTLKPYSGLEAYNYGIFTGSSLHEIAHAAAAGGAGGVIALDTQVILLNYLVKIYFYCSCNSFIVINRRSNDEAQGKMPMPYFIIGFVFMSILGVTLA